MNAQPGDLVECIDDKPSREGIMVMVEKGKIYLVNALTVTPSSQRPAYELDGVCLPDGTPFPQSQYRFRKIDGPGDAKSFKELLGKHASKKQTKELEDA